MGIPSEDPPDKKILSEFFLRISLTNSYIQACVKMIGALSNLRTAASLIFGCNLFGYAATVAFETHKLTDLIGAGSFVVATVYLSYQNELHRNIILGEFQHKKLILVNIGVVLWGVRLSTFLFSRVLKVGEDKRLRKFFRKPGESYFDSNASFFPVRLATFWFIQSLWGILCLLPVIFLNSVPLFEQDGSPNALLEFDVSTQYNFGELLLSVPTYMSKYRSN
jgi:steroid 5-alpha reductase family enzyme